MQFIENTEVVMSNDKAEQAMIKMFKNTFTRASEMQEALHKAVVKKMTEMHYPEEHVTDWRTSPTNPQIGIMTFAIKVEGGGEVLIDFEMPINEIVEHTSNGFTGQPIGLTWRHADPEWYMPLAKAFIRTKLDEMGYDFIEGHFIAVKRTGMWG